MGGIGLIAEDGKGADGTEEPDDRQNPDRRFPLPFGLRQCRVLFEEVVVAVAMGQMVGFPGLGEQTDDYYSTHVKEDTPTGAVECERISANADEAA